MIPVLTAAEMRAADAAALEGHRPDALLARAGVAVGLLAATMVGRTYGAHIAVLAGPGHNGDDGRLAADFLRQRGARVSIFNTSDMPEVINGVDLIIDAAFGIGCTRDFVAPRVDGDIPVLAVDLPSGVDADTGEVRGAPMVADVTLALGALKPAHLVGESPQYCGEVVLNTLDIRATSRINVVEVDDAAELVVPQRDDHKWLHAIHVAAGSESMSGAAALVCAGALATGASMIRLHPFGELTGPRVWPDEVVLSSDGTIDPRCRAVVVGPGVGNGDGAQRFADRVVASSTVPIVLDADGITRARTAQRAPGVEMVVTPHGGELRRLLATSSGNLITDAQTLARELNVTVLIKGPITVVADPSGETRLVTTGTSALATAGTGDVLSGMIGAALSRGFAPIEAASLAATLHGLAGQRLAPYGQASRMDDAIRQVLRELDHAN